MPMPSVTVGTPNTCGIAPAALSASIARSTSGWMPALQGFIVEWPFATPTIGFSKSPSPKPTARSIARLGERATPCVIRRERRFIVVMACFRGEVRDVRVPGPAILRARPRASGGGAGDAAGGVGRAQQGRRSRRPATSAKPTAWKTCSRSPRKTVAITAEKTGTRCVNRPAWTGPMRFEPHANSIIAISVGTAPR